jgi:hypothetical protein
MSQEPFYMEYVDDHAVKLWQPHLNPEIPADLADALADPFVQCWAWAEKGLSG